MPFGSDCIFQRNPNCVYVIYYRNMSHSTLTFA